MMNSLDLSNIPKTHKPQLAEKETLVDKILEIFIRETILSLIFLGISAIENNHYRAMTLPEAKEIPEKMEIIAKAAREAKCRILNDNGSPQVACPGEILAPLVSLKELTFIILPKDEGAGEYPYSFDNLQVGLFYPGHGALGNIFPLSKISDHHCEYLQQAFSDALLHFSAPIFGHESSSFQYKLKKFCGLNAAPDTTK